MGGTKSLDMNVAQLNILSPELAVNALEQYEKCLGKQSDIDAAKKSSFSLECPQTYSLLTKFIVLYSDFILNPRNDKKIQSNDINRSHPAFSRIRNQDNFLSMLGYSDESITLIKRDLTKFHNLEQMNKGKNKEKDQLLTPASINTLIDQITIFMKTDKNYRQKFSTPKDDPRKTNFSSSDAMDQMCFSSLDRRNGVKLFNNDHFDKDNLIKFFELDNSFDKTLDPDRDSKVNRVLKYDKTTQSKNAPIMDQSIIQNILDLVKRKIIQVFIFLFTTNDVQSKTFREKLTNFQNASCFEIDRDQTVEQIYKFMQDEDISDIMFNLIFNNNKSEVNLAEIYDKDTNEHNLKLKEIYCNQIAKLNKDQEQITNVDAKFELVKEKLPGLDLFIINEVTADLQSKIYTLADQNKQSIFPPLKTKDTGLKIVFDEEIKIEKFITILIVNENRNQTLVKDSGQFIQQVNDELNQQTIDKIPINANHILRNCKVVVSCKKPEFSVDVYCLHLPSETQENKLRREYVKFILDEQHFEKNPENNKKFLLCGDMNEEFFGENVRLNTKEVIDDTMNQVMGDNIDSQNETLRREFMNEKTTSKCRTGMQCQISKIANHDEKFKDIIIGNASYKLYEDKDKKKKIWKNEMVDISDHKQLQMLLQW